VRRFTVDFAFLCDDAGPGEEGKLDARGIGVDTFIGSSLPGVLPLLFAGRLSGIDLPTHLKLRFLDADAQVLLEQPVSVRAAAAGIGRPRKLPILACEQRRRPFQPRRRRVAAAPGRG
jgi:hypothetical protein